MLLPPVAIFEGEFVLAALFGGRASDVALRAGVAKDRGAELLVNQNARGLPRRAPAQRQLESFIDHLLAGDHLGGLRFRERRLEAEQAFFEARSLIERHDEERAVVTEFHCPSPSQALPALR